MTSNSLLVSILIPTFQQEKFIQECIDSVRNQKVNFNIEILVGDDCSTDSTAEIAQKLTQVDPRIHLYKWIPNEGGLKNIDKLLSHASGKYVTILEGDDYWLDSEHLSKCIHYLEDHPGIIFACANYLHLSGKELAILQRLHTKSTKMLRYWHLALGNFIQMGTIIYRRSYYSRIPNNYFGVPLGDYPLILTLLSNGTGVYLPHDAMAYRLHAAGVWSAQPPKTQAAKTLEVIRVITKGQNQLLNEIVLSAYRCKLELQTGLPLNLKRLVGFGIFAVLFFYRIIWIK